MTKLDTVTFTLYAIAVCESTLFLTAVSSQIFCHQFVNEEIKYEQGYVLSFLDNGNISRVFYLWVYKKYRPIFVVCNIPIHYSVTTKLN